MPFQNIPFQFGWIEAPWVKWARKGVSEAFVAGVEVSVTLPVVQQQVDFYRSFPFSVSQPRCHWMVYGSTSKCSWPVRNHPQVAEKIIAKLTQDGTKKFQVTQLTKEMRADIHKDMRPFVEVTDKDLIASTATHLDNIAIRTEIATAVETYKRSKLFLAGIKATRAS